MSIISAFQNAYAGAVRSLRPAPAIAALGEDVLPLFRGDGLLPVGVHDASIGEFMTRFANSPRRKSMAEHLVAELHKLGIEEAWIGGSFVSAKRRPGDIDVAVRGKEGSLFDGGLVDRHAARRGIHIYSYEPNSPVRVDKSMWPFYVDKDAKTYADTVDFWSHGRSGERRGVIHLKLDDLQT